MSNAASQSIDPFKSILEEGKDTSMLAGSRRNFNSKSEQFQCLCTVKIYITAECYGNISVLAKRLNKFMTYTN